MRLMVEALIVCLVCIVVVEFAATAEQTKQKSNTTKEPTTHAPITTSTQSSTTTVTSTEVSTTTLAPPTTPTNKISPSPMLTTAQQKAYECRHEGGKLTAVEYALIAVGSFLLLVLIVAAVLFLCCRRRCAVDCSREHVGDRFKLNRQPPMCPLPSRKPSDKAMGSTTPTDLQSANGTAVMEQPYKQKPVKQELYMQQPYKQTPFNSPFASPARSPLNDDDDGLVPFMTPEELRAQETAKNAQHTWPNAHPW
jgi:hypothetical protein